jgi:hypothetical protein
MLGRLAASEETRGLTVRIQSHDSYYRIGSFSPETGELKFFRRRRPSNASAPIGGHYSHLDKKFVMIWRSRDGLHLMVDSLDVSLDPGVKVSWHRVDAHRAQLVIGVTPEIVITYLSDLERLTSMAAEAIMGSIEDWDFGYFLNNVLNDPGRRSRIYPREANPG